MGSGITTREFRDALGRYASGITVVAGCDDDGPFGFTCQSFHSVSVQPPLVSFTVSATSLTHPRVRGVGTFSASVLSHEQQQVSDRFAQSGTDRWAGLPHAETGRGTPVIPGCLLWLDCDVVAEHPAGDHVIVVGGVVGASSLDPAPGTDQPEPLLYFRGRYRHLRNADT
jgi:3-hydroxy-9,10-secoandrosta-1,3,5(10)-triene-9,17-dione monooxygenase reductase component